MNRVVRTWMHENLGINPRNGSLPARCVRKWIGFAHDEWHRIKEPLSRYEEFCYPLIDLKMGAAEIAGRYLAYGITPPPRSVCNACFANDVAYFREMYFNRPDDWAQAVAVDDEIRDLRCIGIRDECFVSSTCIPLRELILSPEDFSDINAEADQRCHSGHCFV